MAARKETVKRDSGESRKDWIVTIAYSPERGCVRRHFSLDEPLVRLDREGGDQTTVVLEDPTVSAGKVHLEGSSDGFYEIVDTGSTNAVRINGAKLDGRRRLLTNDVIRVGDSLLVIEKSDATRTRFLPRDSDALLSDLCLFESTARSILLSEIRFFDPDFMCVAINAAGIIETRMVGDWLSMQWDKDLERIDAVAPNIEELLEDASADVAVLVERIDSAPSELQAKLVEAIEYRARGPAPRRVVFSFAGAPTRRSLVSKLIDTTADVTMAVPSLVDRRCDILPGLVHLVAENDGPALRTMPPLCVEKLLCYSWPGGISEMRRVARRLSRQLAEEGQISQLALTAEIRAVEIAPDAERGRTFNEEAFARAFREFNGNMKEIAGYFGYARTYLYRLLRQRGIDIETMRESLED